MQPIINDAEVRYETPTGPRVLRLIPSGEFLLLPRDDALDARPAAGGIRLQPRGGVQ